MSTSFEGQSLGNLAQSARTKQLKSARGILLFVGILTAVVNVGLVVFAESIVDSQIEQELKDVRGKGMEIDQNALHDFREQAVRGMRLANGIAVLIGAAFIVCAMYVYRYPVPATVISLVMYLGAAAVYGVLDPTTLVRGWWMKIIIVVCLFKAVQAALAYESERKSGAESVTPEFPAAPA